MNSLKKFLIENKETSKLILYPFSAFDIKYGEYFAKFNLGAGGVIIFTNEGILHKTFPLSNEFLKYKDIEKMTVFSDMRGVIFSKDETKNILLNGINLFGLAALVNKLLKIYSQLEKSEKGNPTLLKVCNQIINYSKNQKINILLVGGTGVGKSSTINALFGSYEAEVGAGQNPETMEMIKYELDNFILWDSPGLGDSTEKDKMHSKKIEEFLKKKNKNNNKMIDIILVIIDGSSRQLESTYKLIKEVLVPNIDKERIVIGVNKIDKAVGKYWDNINNCPKPEIKEFIENKIRNPIEERIEKDTGIKFSSICYNAGEIDIMTRNQEISYNIDNLFYNILTSISITD